MKYYESRDVIYGFIPYDEWEREIINHPVFQRLRRIKQLSMTDMLYAGATHTRFEHSLGVMHFATLLFDNIVKKRHDYLRSLQFNDAGLARDRQMIRIAALLHDIGHSPFSHAGEDLMPFKDVEKSKKYSHEDYSIAIIKNHFKDVIENHPINYNYGFKVEDITALIGDESVKPSRRTLVWKNMISSQLDADRADYLLRDSYHMGVSYGLYDKDRLINSMSLADDDELGGATLTVDEGGWHVAESLVIARYQMFSQVYFHKTRRAYDKHIEQALKEILKTNFDMSGFFPVPCDINLDLYVNMDDWLMFGKIKEGSAGEAGKKILERNHDRCIYATSETPSLEEISEISKVEQQLGDIVTFKDEATKSWYKVNEDIKVLKTENHSEKLLPLSNISSIVNSIKKCQTMRLYAESQNKKNACDIMQKLSERGG
jgi:hypothetical protein